MVKSFFWLAALAGMVAVGTVAVADDEAAAWPSLPKPVASFGAAVSDGTVYVYGGHVGRAHSHSKNDQQGTFFALDLNEPSEWKALPSDLPIQGLALVAAGGKLYRIGGMHARNEDPDAPDLISVATVRRFDPASGEWSDYVDLPDGRSSHDAVAVGSKIYVVGGWTLRGAGEEPTWHNTSLVLDTAAENPQWQALPEQPFVRRALAVAEADGKLFALGGIEELGTTSREVNVYDIAQGQWVEGPELPGEDLHGFGVSAYGFGGAPVASGMNGVIYRLSANGEQWHKLGQLEHGRFFHRILPAGKEQALAIAGAAHGQGHMATIEQFPAVKP